MKILFIGDIVGEPGRDVLRHCLPGIFEQHDPDITVANGENAAGGKGITLPVARELFDLGINVLTLGNHTFDRRDGESALQDARILRPANYPAGVPGKGFGIYPARGGDKVAVVSLMGRVYLPLTDCPFHAVSDIIEKVSTETRIILVDFHAEVTSEKQAMGWYLDGRVSAMIGTHTHIPTADEQVLPGGTAYQTDTGMTGPMNGVIGMDRELVLKKFLTAIPQHFEVARGSACIQGVIIDVDASCGKAKSIQRIDVR